MTTRKTVTLDSSLSRAVPVRPDIFLERLDMFIAQLPTIRILRMCHRFGQGPSAVVTKLPIELLHLIELNLIWTNDNTKDRDGGASIQQDWFNKYAAKVWREVNDLKGDSPRVLFRCFESRCQPYGHRPDFERLLELTEENMPCEACLQGHCCENACEQTTQDRASACGACRFYGERFCRRSCDGQRDDMMNHRAQNRAVEGWKQGRWIESSGDPYPGHAWHEWCTKQWSEMLMKFDATKRATVLYEHFGLHARFCFTTHGDVPRSGWADHRNYGLYEDSDNLATAICFLFMHTASSQTAAVKNIHWQDFSSESPYEQHASKTLCIDSQDAMETTTARTRIQHAMSVLGVLPWIHPSHESLRAGNTSDVEPKRGDDQDGARDLLLLERQRCQ